MRNPLVLLNDILQAIQNIDEYTKNCNFKEFKSNTMLRDAVIRNIEIIGEASRSLPIPFKTKHAHIQWRYIIAMRNLVAHEYFGIDLSEVWQVIQKEIPALKIDIEEIVQTLDK